jgi:chromosome segregation ATPase
MMRAAAALALMLLLGSPAAAADATDAALRAALERALAAWPEVTSDAPDTSALRARLAEARATRERLDARRAVLEQRLAELDSDIAALQKRLVEDPNAMRTPRDQVAVLALHDQRETTRQFRDALVRNIARLTEEIAATEVRLLALKGGRQALEKKLAQLTP